MNHQNTSNKALLTTFVLFLFCLPLLSNAQTPAAKVNSDSNYKVLAPLPCIESPARTVTDGSGNSYTVPAITCLKGGNGAIQPEVSFKTYIQYTFNLLIALSAVAAVVMIVWGGFEYMLSGTVMGKNDGIGRVKNALFGLILVLGSYLLLRTIDPRLVNISSTLVPPIKLSNNMVAPVTLLQQLEADANEFDLRRDQIGALLQETASKKQAKQAELDGINAKLAEMSSSEPEYQSLLLAKAKAENELKKLGVNFTSQLSESAMNGTLTSAANASLNPQNEVVDVIDQINKDEKKIKEYEKLGTTKLNGLGENDTRKIKDNANYALATLNLIKLNKIIDDIPSRLSSIFSTTPLSVEKDDGSGRMVIVGRSEAKISLQNKIAEIEEMTKSLTDQSKKSELEIKIASIKKALVDKLGK